MQKLIWVKVNYKNNVIAKCLNKLLKYEEAIKILDRVN